ncbi:MAG: hypothetical protein DWQ05_08105 [Calditrichaeota bacterium]|nr:MAG: hypothetical protein DWQ05_08105 [Calditrichota bacterium]
MKIRRLRFLNINSLRGEWEIDFTAGPLADAGLFAITGPTGSGKSSILDAITVALYGSVPRYGNERPEEIMTRHTAESFSEVEFEIRNVIYRSKWAIYRARKKSDGKIQPVQMELAELQSNTLLDLKPSEVPAKIEEITGLDKHRFMRSVMLAQGDFAAFLQAKEKERGELLEKITGLEIYSEISKEAYERDKNEKQKLAALESEINAEKLLSAEAIQELNEQMQGIENQTIEFKNQINEIQKQEEWLKKIAALEHDIARIEEQIAVNQQHLQAFKSEAARLQKHNELLPLRAEFQLVENKQAEVIAEENEQRNHENDLKICADKKDALEEKLKQNLAELQRAETRLKHEEPLIERTKDLDKEIAQQQKLVDTKTKDLQNLRETEKNLIRQTAQLKQRLAGNNHTLQENETWLQHNHNFAQLEKEWALINNLLTQIAALREAYKEAETEYKHYEHAVELLEEAQKSNMDVLKKNAVALQQTSDKISSMKTALNEKRAGRSADELDEENRVFAAQVTTLVIMQEIAERYSEIQQKSALFNESIGTLEAEIATTQTQAQTLAIQREQAEKERDLLQKIVEQNRRIAKYEDDRRHLHAGEACPLCGALDHPFVDPEHKFSETDDEKNWREKTGLCESLLREENELRLRLNGFETRLQNAIESRDQLEEDRQSKEKKFNSFNQQLENDFEISNLEGIKLAAEEIHEQRNNIETLQKELKEIESNLQTLAVREQELKEQSLTLSAELKSNEKQIAAQKLEKTNREKVLVAKREEGVERHEKLDALLEKYNEKTPRASELQDFENRMQKAMHEFLEKSQRNIELKNEQTALAAELAGEEKILTQKSLEREKYENELLSENNQLQEIQATRIELFGEQNPDEVLQSTRKAIEDTKTRLEQVRAEHAEAKSAWDKASARLASAEKKLETSRNQFQKMEADFLLALQKKGCASKEDYKAIFLSEEEVEGTTRKKKQLDDDAVRLAGNAEKTRRELEKEKSRKLTDNDAASLLKNRLEIEQLRSKSEQEKGEINERLRQNEALKKEFAATAKKIEKQQSVWQKWHRLSKLIGSSDGSVFSRFAQGLTLARLVQLANRHLVKLHDRYAIDKMPEADLELQIIDRYQADTTRPMRSLSGGESFLVSLALALGLSDLASRRNRIDSLFIDEGFGTLDADTLETAISTLENLQQSGKSIGVISHVEALKERLMTQIQLQKQSGGVSTLAVVDGGIPASGVDFGQ